MWSLPNILTAGRIASAPVVALAALAPAGSVWTVFAFALFVVAALTDWLDGWLARRHGQVSALGTMLDPIADKAMVILVLATLTGIAAAARGAGTGPLSAVPGALIALPAMAIVLREVLVSGLREYLGAVKLAVTRLAKGKTAAQLVAVGALLWVQAEPAVSLMLRVGIAEEARLTLLAVPVSASPGLWLAVALLWLAATLTVLSGIDYFRKARPHLAAREEG